jgi:ElaB/YqjD/DUF883 family membrane-anchored ribosome-binding protein
MDRTVVRNLSKHEADQSDECVRARPQAASSQFIRVSRPLTVAWIVAQRLAGIDPFGTGLLTRPWYGEAGPEAIRIPPSERRTPHGQPIHKQQPSPSNEEGKSPECPPDRELPENSQENLDTKLDQAIEETFPTSDPVSVTVTKAGAINHDQQEAGLVTPEQGQDSQGASESLLDQAKNTLRDAAGRASGAAREAYNQGQRYVRQAGDRYPDVDRAHQESHWAIGQRVAENPVLSLFVAGVIGYALAWMVLGHGRSRNEQVPDYARTNRGYTPQHGAPRGS